MKTIIIANSDPAEAEEIKKVVDRYFKAAIIPNPADIKKIAIEFDLILLNHNFIYNSGIDFLMDNMGRWSVPILILMPDDDPKYAIEKHTEREELKDTITDLLGKLEELEEKISVRVIRRDEEQKFRDVLPDADKEKNPLDDDAEPEKGINIVEEIITQV
jgi:hypothetical protein